MALSWGNTATTPSSVQSVSNVKANEDTRNFVTPASTAINAGDLLLWNSTAQTLALMSNAMWDTNLLTTQEDVAPVFMGIALGAKDAADARTGIQIPVCVKGFAAYPAAAVNTVYAPGQFIAAAAQGTNNLSDFQVVIASNILAAIGRSDNLFIANATYYGFWFQSALIFGGLQSATP